MANLSSTLKTTQVVYNGETFELGSEEARIIYTALKELGRSGNIVSDGYLISGSAPNSGNATAGQLFVTSSQALASAVDAGDYDVLCVKR